MNVLGLIPEDMRFRIASNVKASAWLVKFRVLFCG